MTGATRRAAMLAGCLVLGLALAGCNNDNDPTAPEGSTIRVSANPQTVVVPTGGSGSTLLIATVSFNGTRLPDQEVTFSTTSGTLSPPAETPLKTDSMGQATSTLTTSSAATVTASTGSITASTQIQVAPGNISQFLLNVSPQFLFNCIDPITLTATVNDTAGNPLQGLVVIFNTEVPPTTVSGTFNPIQTITDASGQAISVWKPESTSCLAECQASTADPKSPNPGQCTLFFTASDTTGSFISVSVEVIDSIP